MKLNFISTCRKIQQYIYNISKYYPKINQKYHYI